jgi:alpha-tubulin suppressor-like RCC1 family protein
MPNTRRMMMGASGAGGGEQMYGWGYSENYVLQTPGITNHTTPIEIGSAGEFTQAAVNKQTRHALYLKEDGTMWSIGANGSGECGLNNTTTPISVLTQVGTDTDWAKVGTGIYRFSCAIKTNGTLWAWGLNSTGVLGQGNTTNLSVPTQVGSLTNWGTLRAGRTNILSVKTDGTLWGIGGNSFDALGVAGGTNQSSPVQIGSDTNWVDAATGGMHCVALKSTGTLWGWGYNYFGQTGNGGSIGTYTPVAYKNQVGSATTWNSVFAFDHAVLATQTNGTIWGYGMNSNGQLGIGNTTNTATATQMGSLTNWRPLSQMCTAPNSGHCHSKTDGTMWQWGGGPSVAYGSGATSSPVQGGTETDWQEVWSSDTIGFGLRGADR